MSQELVIINSARSAIGDYQGNLAPLSASEIGGQVIKHLIKTTNIDPKLVSDCITGCVLQAGQGQAPARQTALAGGLSHSVHTMTVNKICGSGLMSTLIAADMLKAGSATLVAAGGIESMSNAPYLVPKARAGLRMGHSKLLDHMFYDGLEDAYDKGTLMGVFAEKCASGYNFSREEQDTFAINSLNKAKYALDNNLFNNEIAPITITTRKKEIIIDRDELPAKAKPEKIPLLKPAFAKDGTVTAANASSLSDGASFHLVTTSEFASKHGLKARAVIKAYSCHSQDPQWFTTAPVEAIRKCLTQANWSVDDVDLFEINEAFAVVTMACIKDINIDQNKVNIFGGACALGHPIGASGARIVTTLINALEQKNLKKGLAAVCIGGGEACALAIELV